MKRAERGQGAGYTIIETLIFLAVSAAMFVSAMAFVSGRQNRTEFSSAVRDFEASINDIANDVSNGYYANITEGGGRIYCQVVGGAIQLQSRATDTQGGNQGCLFIGKALLFNMSDYEAGQYLTVPLVGTQYKNGVFANGDSESYADSSVVPIAKTPDHATTPNAYEVTRLAGGVTVGCVIYSDNTAAGDHPCSATPVGVKKIDSVAFMTTFQAAALTDAANRTGSADVNIIVSKTGLLNGQTHDSPGGSQQLGDIANPALITSNPKGGVYVCLQSNGTDQHALISIGGESSRFSTNTTVVEGNC